jgi:hypothetical protein
VVKTIWLTSRSAAERAFALRQMRSLNILQTDVRLIWSIEPVI